jgi:hypothetical protein
MYELFDLQTVIVVAMKIKKTKWSGGSVGVPERTSGGKIFFRMLGRGITEG